MIRTVIKLAFVALLANAAWQLFNAYWPYYKFSDAVRATAQYRGQKTDAQVRERILELAAQFDIPISDDNLTVRLDDTHTIVEAAYVQPVALAPGYTYQWPFSVHVDTIPVTPKRLEDLDPPK
jgi:hypothetical protein